MLFRSVFRVKGVIGFNDSDRGEIFQYVCGRYDFTPSDLPADSEKYLVFIGKNIDRKQLDCFSGINTAAG